MSLESWKKEFYTVDAEEVPKEEALDHSIKKWEGLTSKNLSRHDLEWNTDLELLVVDGDGQSLEINSSTCALCWHYLETSPHTIQTADCLGCPLDEVEECCLDTDSAYRLAYQDGGEAMRNALAKAKEWEMNRK